jgi:hypothetical protein
VSEGSVVRECIDKCTEKGKSCGNQGQQDKRYEATQGFSIPFTFFVRIVSFCKHKNYNKLNYVTRPIRAGLEPILFFRLSIGSACKKLRHPILSLYMFPSVHS